MNLTHQDYRWVDTAFGDWRRRNKPLQIQDVGPATPADRRDCFVTWHRFPAAYVQHVKICGTVSGYGGPSFADFLPIDFDGADLAQVQAQLREFLKVLNLTYEIDGLRGVRVYFSGAKGFHVLVSSALFGGWEPSAELPLRLKRLARRLTEGFAVDDKIYDQNRLLRLPNTVNIKSGLYKIPLETAQVLHEGIDKIVLLAQAPREVVWPAWDDVEPSPACQALWESVGHQQVPQALKPKQALSVDAEALFPTGMKEGDGRDNQAFVIARYCRDHRFPESATNQLLEVWDAAQVDPLGRQVIQQKVRSAYARLDGVGDTDITGADVLTPEELAEHYDRYIERLKSSKITLGLGPVDGRLRGVAPGEVCTLIARTGVGKTALLQNILRHIAAKHDATTLFCSLEQPVAQVFERYAQMGLERSGEQIEATWAADRDLIASTVKADLGERTMTCGRSLSLGQLDQALDVAQDKAGRPVSVLALDYLGLLDTRDLDKTLYGQVSQAARAMKNLAKRRDLAVICLCQVSRASGDDGSQPLTSHSARESGAIEEAADFLLGMYRPDLKGDDKTIRVQILKNRKGQEGVEFTFDFDKVSLRITAQGLVLAKNGGVRREY
ncbi:MAG: AAA family ATPase [Chloroflexi bacterium]|nr:AAA family ATPase [Chloroflexota bacterium]